VAVELTDFEVSLEDFNCASTVPNVCQRLREPFIRSRERGPRMHLGFDKSRWLDRRQAAQYELVGPSGGVSW